MNKLNLRQALEKLHELGIEGGPKRFIADDMLKFFVEQPNTTRYNL